MAILSCLLVEDLMNSTLPHSALRDYQRLAAPYLQQIGEPHPQEPEEDHNFKQRMEAICRDALSVEDEGWPIDSLFQLCKTLEIATYLRKATDTEWLLLRTIFETIRTVARYRPLSDSAAWETAIQAAVHALNRSSIRHTRISGSREEIVASAFMALKRKGYPYVIDAYGVRLTAPAYRKICACIEDKIERVGGLYTASALLTLMQRLGRVEDGALLHARMPSTLPWREVKAGTPWHFIYNLALKHFDSLPKVRNPEPVLLAMEDLARNLTAAIDVEPHSIYENMSIGRSSLSKVIHDTTLYDEFFSFPQWQPLIGSELVSLWLDALNEAGCELPFFRLEEWKSLAASIIRHSQSASLSPITSYDLSSQEVSQAQASLALELLSTTHPNKNYSTPTSTLQRTSTWHPIIKTTRAKYFIQPSSLANRSFCECLYALMRASGDGDIENKIGKALEEVTIKVLSNFGIKPTVAGEQYFSELNRTKPEVDIVVETDERIFLIECTKKSLTTSARGGGTLAALLDLEGSFLKLTQQLAQHEAELRVKGCIRFTNGKVLELRGRHIEKIGLNLFDHGSLQSRDFTIALIEMVAGASMIATATEASSAVEAINKRLKKLNKSILHILDAQSDAQDRALFRFAMSTWWLSIDQLFYALQKGNGDLWSSLRVIRHLTARSGDFVYELKRSSNLNGIGQAMFDVSQKMDSRAII